MYVSAIVVFLLLQDFQNGCMTLQDMNYLMQNFNLEWMSYHNHLTPLAPAQWLGVMKHPELSITLP